MVYDSYLTIPKPHTPGVFILQVFKERIYLDSIGGKREMLKGTFLGTKWYSMREQYHVVQYERTVPRGYSMMVQYL